MNQCESKYFLTIDNGTQSVRALVFDRQGQLLAKSKINIVPYVEPQAGWAEQDPQYYWDSLCKACQQVLQQLNAPKESIAAVSVTTQRTTAIALDVNGDSLYPAITWLDRRKVDTKPALGFIENMMMRLLKVKPSVDDFHAQSEVNWLAQNKPEVWQQVHKYLMLSGYHNFRLTGQYKDAVASQVGYLPFDFKKLGWAKTNDWKWRAIPTLRPDMLPELVKAGEVLGHITTEASKDTGIPAGVPVIASGSDKACEVLGSGCIETGIGSLSYGTTATLNIAGDKYLEPVPNHPAYPGIIPQTYNTEVMVNRGYWMVTWYKEEFGLQERLLAKEKNTTPEILLDELLRSTPPGSLGLVLQPYWGAGTSAKDPSARGAMIGFGEMHTRAHIYRSIIEGLTFALREGKELLEKRSGKLIDVLNISGGGSQSNEVMQISANIFGMNVHRPHTFETSGLGAAIACAVATNVYPDFKIAVSQMVHSGDVFKPNPEHQQVYDRLYKEVYSGMYGSLQTGYQKIQKITGYPS